jgi:hypothetical protein
MRCENNPKKVTEGKDHSDQATLSKLSLELLNFPKA